MEDDLILLVIPAFVVLIGVEFVYGRLAGNNNYRLNDTLSSLSQGLISQAVALCTPLIQYGLYGLLYDWITRQHPTPLWFAWSAWYGWLAAFLIYDFSDYWLHRVSHQCAFFWGAHVVHHQSQFFNLSTALRQESLYPIVGCFFFFPMALLGIEPQMYLKVALFVLVYQFWIHTEHIGTLGWMDQVFSTPSNHRVHHAINANYIDKNFGAVLVIWDRLFGTFQPEQEPCVYGTSQPLNSWNPAWALLSVYADLLRRARSASGWRNRCRVFYKNPGWTTPGVDDAGHQAKSMQQQRYDPPFRRHGALLSIALFLLAAMLLGACLYWEDQITFAAKLLGAVLIGLSLYLCGYFLEFRSKRH